MVNMYPVAMTIHTAAQILTRDTHRARPGPRLPLAGDLDLVAGRVHEFCGLSRRTLALSLAGAATGPVIWIAPSWTRGGPCPDGFAHMVAPGRLTFAAPDRAEDLLWCMEEALRSGVVPVVVADLPAPPALTPVRRLHLAAETGAREGTCTPLGLILTPEGAAPGVETRWACDPRHGTAPAQGDARSETWGWHLRRLRDRTAPVADWHVTDAPERPMRPIRPAAARPHPH